MSNGMFINSGEIEQTLMDEYGSDSAVVFVGRAGVGKTQGVRSFAKNMNLYMQTIEGSVTMDGDAVLTTIVKRDASQLQPWESEVDRDRPQLYPHKAVQNIYDQDMKQKNGLVKDEDKYNGYLLFIDEFNRAERGAMASLMNLLLTRELGGVKLPVNTIIVAAMNPTDDMPEFADTNDMYNAQPIDTAVLDRFSVYFISEDVNGFTNYGLNNDSKETIKSILAVLGEDTSEENVEKVFKSLPDNYQTRINSDIVEFLNIEQDYMYYTSDELSTVIATPRSWEAVSKYLLSMKIKNPELNEIELYERSYNAMSGKIGRKVNAALNHFVRDPDQRVPVVSGLFEGKKISEKYVELTESQNFIKMYIFTNNLSRFLKNKVEDAGFDNLSTLKDVAGRVVEFISLFDNEESRESLVSRLKTTEVDIPAEKVSRVGTGNANLAVVLSRIDDSNKMGQFVSESQMKRQAGIENLRNRK